MPKSEHIAENGVKIREEFSNKFMATAKVRKSRLDICGDCEFFKLNICTQCGCIVQAKAALSSASCPVEKW